MYILFIYLGADNHETLHIKICKYIAIFVLSKKGNFGIILFTNIMRTFDWVKEFDLEKFLGKLEMC